MSSMMNRLLMSSRRQPAHGSASAAREPMTEPLWLEWLTLAGLLIFASWLLGVRGVFAMLLQADPTGITLVIMVVFAGATLWCGARSRTLQQQRQAMLRRTRRVVGRRRGTRCRPSWSRTRERRASICCRQDARPQHRVVGQRHSAGWALAR
jgi:hypothetical protein